MALDGALYVGSYGTEKKHWENIVASNPEARLRISGKLYRVRVDPVEDSALTAQINAAYNQKYDMEAVFGADVPEWWFYRVEQRE